jgi:hypothetical protein
MGHMTLRLAVLSIILAGCAHGPLNPLPPVDPKTAATVMVIRESHFVGSGASVTITLDDDQLFAMWSGEHVSFAVAPGEHSVGVRTHNGFHVVHNRALVVAEPGRTYYFEVRPNLMAGPSLNPITAGMARDMMKSTTPVPMKTAQ